MTELKAEYKVTTTANGCPTCRAFGRVGSLGGVDVLLVEGLAVTNLSGVCQDCGRAIHWNSHDRLLARIVRMTVDQLNRVEGCA